MSIVAAALVGGFTYWFVNHMANKDIENDLKQMYQDKYGAEWDADIEPQSMVQWALGYGESPTVFYNEAESEVISGEKRGKVVSMIGSDPRLRRLTKDKNITPEEAMLRREISAEQDFAVEFDDWAEQEMKTHGYNISFREWADEESQSHGDEELLDWAQHEEESHEARYDAEETCQDSHLDGIDFLPWSEDAEGSTCYITGLPNPDGDIEGEDNICEPCAAKWIYDYEGPEGEGYYRASAMNAESLSFDYTPLAKCDICGGHEQVGYVDDDLSLKVCEHCDVDGADYDPKLLGAESYKPPASAVANAKRGLTLRKEFGRGGLSPSEAKAQGIDSGVTRARKIASGKVSRHDVRRMSAFNRHRKNNNPSKKMPDGGPTAGTIAWLLWGGTSGVNWAKNKSAAMNAESFGPVDEDGQLAKALRAARAKKPTPLKLTKLPHRDQKSLKDYEEFNSAIVYQKPKGIIAQVMAKEKALQQLALSEAILELEQYIRLGMISEEDAFKKIVQMSR